MRLLIAAVGRLKQGPEREFFAHYLARAETAGRKLGLSPVTVIEVPEFAGAHRSHALQGRGGGAARQASTFLRTHRA